MLAFLMAAAVAAAPPAAARQAIPETLIENAIENGRLIQARDMIDLARRTSRQGDAIVLLRLEGLLALAERRDGDAFQAFAKAAERGTGDCRVDEGMGIAALRLDHVHAARRSLLIAAAKCPDRWRVWNALGVVYDRDSDWASSNSAYARAAALAPGSRQIANNRGYSLILQHRFGEAVTLLEATVRDAPGDARARRNLDIARVAAGQEPAPRGNTESSDDWAGRLNNAGYIAHLMGRDADAERYLREAIAARSTPFILAENNTELLTHRDNQQ